jgi:4-hydroxy-tetrahydrodipicolinate reductase
MNVAIIGKGRTGIEVIKLLPKGSIHSTFDQSNALSLEKLQGADVAIVFTPGNSVASISEVLLEAGIPVIWGSTGFEWPSDMNSRLEAAQVTWIHGTNFSLGMLVMRHVMNEVGRLMKILDKPECRLVETHHENKVDSPSGTALSWEEWLKHPVEIESIREGDVIGTHRLEIESENELMQFEHRAKSRRIFAEGAIWAAKEVVAGAFCDKGLHSFEKMSEKQVGESHLCPN